MCPAELKERFGFPAVFEVRAEEIAADASEKIIAERFMQNFAAARNVDFEEGNSTVSIYCNYLKLNDLATQN
jgi:hypothetical protein